MSLNHFYNQIRDLPKSLENRDLEEYLLALYRNILENKEKEFSYDLLMKLIKDSFTSEPFEFQNEWLKYDNPPDEDLIDKNLVKSETSSNDKSKLTPIDYTLEVIKFQIAELHKMHGKQLENEYKYFGVTSETGHSWYNFDPFGNLACGARGMIDNGMHHQSLDWSFIGILFEMGSIYE